MRTYKVGIEASAGALALRYGSSVSHVAVDPRCRRFHSPGIDGFIAYRRGPRSVVSLGDPICDPQQREWLAERFRASAAAEGRSTIFAAASEAFTRRAVARGYAAIEFGEDLIFDPRRDPQAGAAGRELRKKVNRARRSGVAVQEHRDPRDRVTEAAMQSLAQTWLARRRGPQVYITPIILFGDRRGRRWFCARYQGALVGLLSLVRLGAREGWVFEHLLSLPEAPQGVSELLVTTALATLGDEGCGYVTFGPSPLPRLGRMENVSPCGAAVGRAVFDAAARWFHLGALASYRRKFQAVASEPSYVLVHPARIGPWELIGLLRAFHVSLRW